MITCLLGSMSSILTTTKIGASCCMCTCICYSTLHPVICIVRWHCLLTYGFRCTFRNTSWLAASWLHFWDKFPSWLCSEHCLFTAKAWPKPRSQNETMSPATSASWPYLESYCFGFHVKLRDFTFTRLDRLLALRIRSVYTQCLVDISS